MISHRPSKRKHTDDGSAATKPSKSSKTGQSSLAAPEIQGRRERKRNPYAKRKYNANEKSNPKEEVSKEPETKSKRPAVHMRWVKPRSAPDADIDQTSWDFTPITGRQDVSGGPDTLDDIEPETSQHCMLPSPPIGIHRNRLGIRVAGLQDRFKRTSASYSVQKLFHNLERNSRKNFKGKKDEDGVGRERIHRGTRLFENNLKELDRASSLIAHLNERSGGPARSSTARSYRFPGYAIVEVDQSYRIIVDLADIKIPNMRQELEIHRLNGSEDATANGFFLNVLPGQTVTVNTEDLTNKFERGNLIVGPLESFTVIEVLGQPLFFWRRPSDRRYNPRGTDLGFSKRFLCSVHLHTNRNVVSCRPLSSQVTQRNPPVLAPILPPTKSTSTLAPSASRYNIDRMRETLKIDVPDIDTKTSDEVLHLWQETYSPPKPPNYIERLKNVGENPCDYVQTKLKDMDGFRENSERELHKRAHHIERRHSAGQEPGQWYLRDDTINLAIASVTQAIMDHEAKEDPQARSGFALTTSSYMSLIKHKRESHDLKRYAVVRPRRCWLIPWSLDEQLKEIFKVHAAAQGQNQINLPHNHTFLIVLQEETDDGGNQHYVAYFLDSNQSLLKPMYGHIYSQIQDMAKVMGWSTHRLGSNIPFDPIPVEIEVAQHDTSIDWSCGYHTIFNAWICALGLHGHRNKSLNLQDHPDRFFNDARNIVNCALANLIDWMTIVAFLECYGFVKRGTIDCVHESRYFSHTRLQTMEAALADQFDELRIPDSVLESQPEDEMPYAYDTNVDFDTQLDNEDESVNLPSDRLKIPQDPATIPGYETPPLDSYEKVDPPPRPPPPSNTTDRLTNNPCKFFHVRFKKVLLQANVQKWMREFRSHRNQVTTEEKVWLQDEEVYLGVAAVTQAITDQQQMNEGFSIMSFIDFKIAREEGTRPHTLAIRPGRTILVPIIQGSHAVLLIIQDHQETNFRIDVLDSMTWQLDAHARDDVRKEAVQVLEKTHAVEGAELKIYPEAFWIPSAQQDATWECGYYAILNAWALAMGLRLNPDFKPSVYPCKDKDGEEVDEKGFFERALDVIHLARGGFLDWRMISAFLRCANFVLPDQNVERHRRFSSTVPQDNMNVNAEWVRRRRRYEEQWLKEQVVDFVPNLAATRIQLPQGRSHRQRIPSDMWGSTVRNQVIHMLMDKGVFVDATKEKTEILKIFKKRFGYLPPTTPTRPTAGTSNHTPEQTSAASNGAAPLAESPLRGRETPRPSVAPKKSITSPRTPRAPKRVNWKLNKPLPSPLSIDSLKEDLRPFISNIEDYDALGLIRLHQQKYSPLFSPYRGSRQGEIFKDGPCHFYKPRLAQREEFRKLLAGQRKDPNRKAHVILGTDPGTGGRDLRITENADRYLSDDDVNLAILSVTEAIMDNNTSGHPAIQPAFTLALAGNVSLVRDSGWVDMEGNNVVRPRRCWLLPWTVAHPEYIARLAKAARESGSKLKFSRKANEHIFLVVLQEEYKYEQSKGTKGEETEFVVYFLDSMPHHLEEVYPIIYEDIKEVANAMKWTTHRNENGMVQFANAGVRVPVAEQENGYACGLHTIINAWICALGLQPNADAIPTNDFYDDAYRVINCALAGIVDYMLIIAFLECHGLIQEGSILHVRQDRHFAYTKRQVSEAYLNGRLDDMVIADYELGTHAVQDMPYNQDFNVDFTKWTDFASTDEKEEEDTSESEEE